MKRWPHFISQFQKDLKLWIYCVLFLFIYRVLFIIVFRAKIGNESSLGDFLKVISFGFRFDSMAASYTVLIPFLLTLVNLFIDIRSLTDAVRNAVGTTFLVLSLILCGVSIGYFKEYDDQFNQFLFGFIYDDTSAILVTIWKEYSPVLSFFVMGIVFVPTFKIKKYFIGRSFVPEEMVLKYNMHPFLHFLFVFLIIVLFMVGLRGSIGSRPAQRHDAAVTKDEFLNKAIFNPHMAFKYAFKDHSAIMGSNGLKVYLPDENIQKAARLVFSKDGSFDNLDEYMKKFTKGPVNDPARHVFLIVMESYDSWALLDKYQPLGLTNGLKGIASQGLYVRDFLPASSGTMTSLASIITGMPDAGLQTNLQKSATRPFSSSIAETFNRLGYKTRFFYGGKLGWRRVGSFTKAQGFREIYGMAHMGENRSGNEWGVDDEYLFDFVSEKVTDELPSFNLILTTTYHPPYDIDIYAKGFPLREPLVFSAFSCYT